MEGTSNVTIEAILGSVGTVFTTCVEWVSDVTGVIVDNPLLLLCCVGLPLCGIGIGLLKRLMRTRV